MFGTLYPFAATSGAYADDRVLNEAIIESYRAGRLGAAMFMGGLFILSQGAQFSIPSQVLAMGFQTVVWSPASWKRMHLMIYAVVIAAFQLWILEFSYTNF